MSVESLPAGDDQWHEMKPGERLRIQASAAGTGGAYVVLEVEVDPGTGVHLHVHDNEDEHFVVVEGTLHMNIDGKTRDLSARSSVTVGRGTPHAWVNRTDSLVRFVAVFTPGRIEGMFRALVVKKVEEWAAVGKAYGMRVLGRGFA